MQNVVTEYLTDALITQVVRELTGDLPEGAAHADDPAAALNRFSLRKARAKDYLRASQSRLILEPVAERTIEQLGQADLVKRLRAVVARIQARGERIPGYAAGNVLSLLIEMGADLRGADFSGICVWQTALHAALLPGVRFVGADLSGATVAQPLQRILDARFGPDGQVYLVAVSGGGLRL